MRMMTVSCALALLDRVEVGFRRNVQDAVGGHGAGPYRLVHLDPPGLLLFPAVLEDPDLAVLGAQVDLAVDPVGRAPDGSLDVVYPIRFAGPGVEAVEIAGQLGGID